MFGLFEKRIIYNSSVLGKLRYELKSNDWKTNKKMGDIDKPIIIVIKNISEIELSGVIEKFEKFFIDFEKRISGISKQVVGLVNNQDNGKVDKLTLISISMFLEKTKLNSELYFEEEGSDELGGHFVFLGMNNKFELDDSFGMDG